MELDNIKLQTTWNDAAGSINNNFLKLKQAIGAIEGGGGEDYTLPLASYYERGGIKIGFSETWVAGSYYDMALKLSSNEAAFIHLTSDILQEVLGYTPLDSKEFTAESLGLADWALAANKPSYTWNEINSKPTRLSDFTNDLDLGLGSLAYKNSLVVNDIPSLPWSKITDGKPTTLAGYGITDGISFNIAIDLSSDFSDIGYGYASGGWKTSGPAAVFGTALYNLRMQCAISNTDAPYVYVSQMYNGVAKEWAELVTYEGAAGKDFEALRYKIGETYVLHRSGNDTYVNYGNRATGTLSLYGTSLYFSLNGTSTPFKIATDGTVSIHDIALTKGTSNSLKAGAYEALNYFADGKLIMHRNAGAENLYFNYGGAAERMYLYGSIYGFHVGASRERAFTIDENKDASFAANLTVAGNMNSKNYPSGKALSQNPTSAFISTIFDADAVSDSSYRMKLVRTSTGFGRVTSPYAATLCLKSADTHGYISIPYSASNKNKCYIGGGINDDINWDGVLFHDNMDLIPKDDGTFYLGYSDKRWRTLNAIHVSANGLFGYVPNGGTYQQYRVLYEGDKLYIQAGSQDGLSTVGKLVICGIYAATLENFAIYSQQTTFSGAVQVNGTSQFVSLATFDKGIKIGDATLTWDAEAGMLKFDKGLYSTGAVTAGGKGSSNKYRLDNWTEWSVDSDGNVTDAKLLESSLSAKLGVELNKRLAEIEESANIGPVKIDLEYIRYATTLTPQQASTAGLTEDVINNMLAGKYTKVISDDSDMEVWDYTAYGSGNSISIYLTQGDGFMVKSGIEMRRDSITANWNVIYEEI